MTEAADRRFMALALSLGRRGQGRVWPWPSVGCVIVQGGRIVGRGCSDAGRVMHAETVALEQAGAAARGATVYVTLEPCSHHGRTPPCADALVAAGVARVVAAMEDPNPQVAGAGLARLKAAGIAVETGLCAAEAAEDHAGFLMRLRAGRPLLTLKLATSLDGRIATASGESRWITGREARRRVHGARLSHDAVMVGGGTARADDPRLTVRGFGQVPQPVRVIVSRHLNLPEGGALAASAGEAPLWLVHGPGDAPAEAAARWRARGARLLEAATGAARQIDPAALLAVLAEAGLTRVFCEGGGALAASLLEADVVDRLVTMQAGIALGAEGRPALGALGIGALADAPRFRLREAEAVGGDVLSTWERAR